MKYIILFHLAIYCLVRIESTYSTTTVSAGAIYPRASAFRVKAGVNLNLNEI